MDCQNVTTNQPASQPEPGVISTHSPFLPFFPSPGLENMLIFSVVAPTPPVFQLHHMPMQVISSSSTVPRCLEPRGIILGEKARAHKAVRRARHRSNPSLIQTRFVNLSSGDLKSTRAYPRRREASGTASSSSWAGGMPSVFHFS